MDDHLQGRTPTSHERMAGKPWDASYTDGPAPWDFGGPQPAVRRLVAAGRIGPTVLDVGCGSGANALCLAAHGASVIGVDVAETALAIARAAARERGLAVEFAVADALRLDHLGRRFDTVLDCGLFHTLDAAERRAYVESLATVVRSGSPVFVLCFADVGADQGPHPVSRDQFAMNFAPRVGWDVLEVEPERIRTRFHGVEGAPAWLAVIKRASRHRL